MVDRRSNNMGDGSQEWMESRGKLEELNENHSGVSTVSVCGGRKEGGGM